jgi:hypothetical protein
LDLLEDLSFLEMEEGEDRRREILDDILEVSFSVSEPEWVVVVLLSLRLLRSFFERVEEEGGSWFCLVVVFPESSQSSCWTSTYSWSSRSWYEDISKEKKGVDEAHGPKNSALLLGMLLILVIPVWEGCSSLVLLVDAVASTRETSITYIRRKGG